jgi:ADP-ribose pyrophosphatase YjhB (NUDIX family)
VQPYPFAFGPQPTSDEDAGPTLADESLVELRCSVLVIRGRDILLIKRSSGSGRDREEHWVLPGGRPRPGEGMLACARREVSEETGVVVQPERCAFLGDVVEPDQRRRQVELVFAARLPANHGGELVGEPDAEPAWVGADALRRIDLRPPIAGFLPAVITGQAPTIPYLGNLWRDQQAGR